MTLEIIQIRMTKVQIFLPDTEVTTLNGVLQISQQKVS
jgi:hypothetical protein